MEGVGGKNCGKLRRKVRVVSRENRPRAEGEGRERWKVAGQMEREGKGRVSSFSLQLRHHSCSLLRCRSSCSLLPTILLLPPLLSLSSILHCRPFSFCCGRYTSSSFVSSFPPLSPSFITLPSFFVLSLLPHPLCLFPFPPRSPPLLRRSPPLLRCSPPLLRRSPPLLRRLLLCSVVLLLCSVASFSAP